MCKVFSHMLKDMWYTFSIFVLTRKLKDCVDDKIIDPG